MLKLRLQRFGSHKSPFYRVVVSESTSPRDGRFVEVVGTYNPVANPAIVNFDEAKVLTWLANGARPTDTVKALLKNAGILAKFADSKNSK